MADDIDELLDEVESKYMNAEDGSQSFHVTVDKSSTVVAEEAGGGGAEELDAAIHSICNIPEPIDTNISRNEIQLNNIGKRRCTVLYVGDAASSEGLSSSVSQRACSNLRCIRCDFKVSAFSNFVWDRSTDYLFLRNNMPVFDKIRAKLQRKKGWCAYGCQCSCMSVDTLTSLKTIGNARWVCGGH